MKSVRRRRRAETFWVTAVSLLLGLLLIFPVIYAFCGAFKTAPEFAAGGSGLLPESFRNLENFREVFARIPVIRYFRNSLAVAVLGTAGKVAFAVLAAYAFAFYDFRGKNVLFFLLIGAVMIPPDTLLITNYLTVSRMGLLNTVSGICLPSLVGASQMFMLRQKFRTFRKEFRDAALMDGCGDLAFLWHILLPMARPVLLTLSVQSFVTLWNAYLWPLMVTSRNETRTIQVGLTMLNSVEDSNYPLILAGVVLAVIPAFLIFLLLRKKLVKGLLTGTKAR